MHCEEPIGFSEPQVGHSWIESVASSLPSTLFFSTASSTGSSLVSSSLVSSTGSSLVSSSLVSSTGSSAGPSSNSFDSG